MGPDRHISCDRLTEYLVEINEEIDTPALEEHLLGCFDCQDRLEAVEAFLALPQESAAQ